jgi:hypothetical protein
MRHAAKIETSDRLQGVLAILKDRAWHGSFELMRQTNLVAIGSAISEIRANGYEVESRCVGQGRYEYRLVEDPTHRGERVEEGVQGATEGRITLAESSPPQDPTDRITGSCPTKWDDWSHIEKQEEQGRMF